MTAQELADNFNVSKRTILRDLDVLTLSNIPIYTVKGRKGGIGILHEYTIDKTFLSKEEQGRIVNGLQILQATSKVELILFRML